jgi:outer membrane lipoprotein-sorting protein
MRILASARCAAFAVILPVLLAACATPPRPQLTPADQAEVDRIAAYLNSIPRFEAHFIQYGSFGPDAGTVWLDRPAGHLRIDYTDAERRVMVIADGQVLVVDRSTGATTTMPVSRTPLGMLLTPTINLSGPITVASLARLPGMVQITLEKTGYASQGNLMLTFADRPLRLIAVAVTDSHGRTLTMRLTGIDTAPALTPGMFQPPPGA